MSPLPFKPFLTKDFSMPGGGIDFLGLRYVNLHMIGNYLIPEINNVTRDMGMFFVGAWVPWKFRQLCQQRDYTPQNYLLFREKAEVAISLAMRDEFSGAHQYGSARNRIGIAQQCELPCELTFKQAGRKQQNTLYAAANYGPSLRALSLITAYRVMAQDGTPLDIAVASDDQDTRTIVEAVDAGLRQKRAYHKLASLGSESFSAEDLDELSMAGLSPSCYRSEAFADLKPCFQRKLLPVDPKDPGYQRTRTARLILATLEQRGNADAQEIRNAWYTGMFSDGEDVVLSGGSLTDQRMHWLYFMARQYQRRAIELFLWCFETALVTGCRSIEDIVDYWEARTAEGRVDLDQTFEDILRQVGGDVWQDDAEATSLSWNEHVHLGHPDFEHVANPQDDLACIHGLRMLAGWYWRMLYRKQDAGYRHLMSLGGSDRVGMGWFLDWLGQRQHFSARELLKDVFSDLVFSQHMRVAISRFDGRAQRLRFVLGDSGIEPVKKVGTKLGKLALPWMPDRLDTFVELLSDIDVLSLAADGTVSLGKRAGEVSMQSV
jgi:hypothetical protein